MRKTLLTLGILVILFASCSVLSPAVPTETPTPPPASTPTPTPTPTPDPCNKENILKEVEDLQLSVNEFKEVEVIANQIDVNSMVFLILRLQEIRYQVMRAKVPTCLETFKTASVNYTGSVMNYLLIFMRDPKSTDLSAAIKTSQDQWQILLSDFNNVLAIAGIQPQITPEASSITPTPSVSTPTPSK
jgi:hypothetical protein